MKNDTQVRYRGLWLCGVFLTVLISYGRSMALQNESEIPKTFQARILPATPPQHYSIGTKRNGVLWNEMRFSTDEGRSWSLVMPESNQPFGQPFHFFNSLVFQAQPHLGLLSVPKGTWATSDSGKSWSRLLDEGFSGIAFSDDNNGWLALTKIRETMAENYITEDGGNTWRLCGTGLAPHQAQLLTKKMGWGIATAYPGPHPNYNRDGVVKTMDGGCSWAWVAKDATNGEYNSIQFLDEKQGWIGGQGWGTLDSVYVYHSIDGGVTWSPIKTPPEGVFSAYFSDAQLGWLDSGNEIDVTTDGGMTWKTVQITDQPVILPAAWQGGQYRLAVLQNEYNERGLSVRKSQKELEASAIQKVLPDINGFQWPTGLLRTDVEVEVTIDVDGNVIMAKSVDLNIPELMLRSLDAAKQWKFPATPRYASPMQTMGILAFGFHR